jgi:hypothetical protein
MLGKHRLTVHHRTATLLEHYGRGVVGGIIGGLWMVLVAAIYGLISGKGIWFPVNLIGATAMREMQGANVEALAQFNPRLASVGLIIHFLYAICVGFLFAGFLLVLPGRPLLWALVLGPLLWVLAFLALPLFNPVMERNLDPLSFAVAHIFYGLIMGLWVVREHPQLVGEEHPDAPHPSTYAPLLGTIIPSEGVGRRRA